MCIVSGGANGMHRRDYLRATGVLCATVGLAGCSSGGDDGGATESPDQTATPTETATATGTGMSESLQAAVSAKKTAISAYRSAVDEFQRLDEDAAYLPGDDSLRDAIAQLESALEGVGAANQGEKVALNGVVAYLDDAARALRRGQPGVSAVTTVVTGLADSEPGRVGSDDALSAVESAEGTLGSMELNFRNLQSDLEGITPNETVLPESEVEAMLTAHSAVRTQVAAVRTLRGVLATYVRGGDAFTTALSNRQEGLAASNDGDSERAEELFRTAREDFRTAGERLAGTADAFDSVTPGLADPMSANLSLVTCRAGAVADASENYAQEMTARIEDDQLAVDKERGDAEFALQRCEPDEGS